MEYTELLLVHRTFVQKVFWPLAVCSHRFVSFLHLAVFSQLFHTLAYNSPNSILKHTNYLGMYSSSMNRYDPIFNVLQYALHPPAVIIVHQAFHSKVIHSQTSLPSHVPSTRFPAGTVLVLLTPVGFNCGFRRSRFSIPITRGRSLLEPPVLVKHFILRVRVADDTQRVRGEPRLQDLVLRRGSIQAMWLSNLAVLGGNDPHSYGVTSRRASMNTLRPNWKSVGESNSSS